jgi:hypothetical protein
MAPQGRAGFDPQRSSLAPESRLLPLPSMTMARLSRRSTQTDFSQKECGPPTKPDDSMAKRQEERQARCPREPAGLQSVDPLPPCAQLDP